MKKQNLLLAIAFSFLPASLHAQEAAPVAPPAQFTPPATIERPLRPRIHNISLTYGSSTSETQLKVGSNKTTSETEKGELEIQYGYEFGYFQPFVTVNSLIEKSGSSESKAGGFALGARASFIENRPGNNLIPFVALSFEGISGDVKSGNNTVAISGRGTNLGLGLDWYPFGEIFAFRGLLSSYSAKTDYSSNTNDGTGDMRGSSFKVSAVLSF